MDVLFKTVHGSNLYGLNHENSDEDFYTVVSKVKNRRAKYAKQTIHDGVDSMVVDFGTWLHQCEMGVPQALEAMFSQMPLVDNIAAFRAGYMAYGTTTWSRYLRTIKSFIFEDDFKRRRHGVRLAINLNELSRTGRFNPTLSDEQKALATHLAESRLSPDVLNAVAKVVSWQG